MVGKFVLIALLSVALVQGDELQAAIQRSLKVAKTTYETGRKRIDSAIAEVAMKGKMVDSQAQQYIQRAGMLQETSRQELRNVAAAMEQKAKEGKNPQAMLACIKRNEQNANRQIEALTRRFKADMERMRTTAQQNIKAASKPLNGMQNALKAKYETAVKDIKNCKDMKCIGTALTTFTKSVDETFAAIRKVQNQISAIVNKFEMDAKKNFENMNGQVNKVKTAGITAIRNCVEKKQ